MLKTLKLLCVVVLSLLSITAFAGGIVTNTNQSAHYVRTLNRNASTDIDAVYYNPAGLTTFDDGMYLHVANQMVWQTKTTINNFPYLNDDEFVGDVFAPLFPNVYFAYKQGKLAVSAGFEPIGGGGSAVYEDGLPSFEIMVSAPLIAGGAQGYRLDTKFEGSSVYYGGQVGVTYKVHDMFSLGLGGRVVLAQNSYTGHIKDIEMTLDGTNWISPGIDDIEVDVEQSATGISPIFSAFITPVKDLGLALRYEMKTELTLENETIVDDSGMFPDGAETHADMPALLALGVGYRVMPSLNAEVDFTYYFNEDVNWDGKEDDIDNGIEFGVALEYDLSEKLLVSAGYLYNDQKVKPEYQTDLSYSLPSNSVAGGFGYNITPKLTLNAGLIYVLYGKDEKVTLIYTEKYEKTTLNIGFGIDYNF
ncbi:MAG: outer membrane beta-barrel protein [Candidatus Marinimicrobia bacterium]|nr:outer membrane beta-barrel protein [Candidatus Neomarinimicrobiota bacterium]MDD5582165.1 outer membrane beta-barrel protein [Candidatus Neomarinimicrobiota bacterium]